MKVASSPCVTRATRKVQECLTRLARVAIATLPRFALAFLPDHALRLCAKGDPPTSPFVLFFSTPRDVFLTGAGAAPLPRDGWRWIVDAHRGGVRHIVHSDE